MEYGGTMAAPKIADLLPDPVYLDLGKGTVELHPLSAADILKLFYKYDKTFLSLYVASSQEKPDYTTLMAAAPDMMDDIIARSMQAVDQIEAIRRIPGTTKLIGLAAIWKISVPDPKKLKESVSQVMAELRPLLDRAKADAKAA